MSGTIVDWEIGEPRAVFESRERPSLPQTAAQSRSLGMVFVVLGTVLVLAGLAVAAATAYFWSH